ncbi:hypothetical protein ACLH0M_14755 [Aeromonas media]
MKRLARNPEKFEAIDIFTKFSRIHDFTLHSPEDTEKFISLIRESLKASTENKTLVHGKRIEALFGHLAASLGNCKLIKSEDAGDVIYDDDDDDITQPDYRLILKDGRHIFVEVKNCNMPNVKSPYTLKKSYVEKLERYGELNGVPIYFAIYYRLLNIWTLLPVSSFIEQRKKYATNPIHSMAKSEMSMLGDLHIGTAPPLIFELVADKTKVATIDESNHANFIIGDVKIYSCGREVVDQVEKNIAFYLMRFGNWDCGEPEAILDEHHCLDSVRFIFNPQSLENATEQGFDIIGHLSSMITSAFNEHTIYEQQVTAIDAKVEPDVFSVKIPEDYKGKVLPLWRFDIQPNPEFQVDV